jgi:predicted nucleic acid-binding protein
MSGVVYDAAALVAADRGERDFWADHRARLEDDVLPIVPALVVVQVSRSPRQIQLRRLLRGCDVLELDETNAHAAGELVGRGPTSDVVDAVVAQAAITYSADIVTADRSDLQRLLSAAGANVRIIEI